MAFRTTAGAVVLAAALFSGTGAAQPQPSAPPESNPPPPPQPSSPGLAGYDPEEGFRLKSKDGNYQLGIALRAALKYEPAWRDGTRQPDGFLAFVRPIIRGHLFKPWFGYLVSMELSEETPFLLDAYFTVEPWKELGVCFGQQGTPVSRHEAFGPHQIFFPDYASVASFFWSGREKGLTLYGRAAGERLEYYAGVYGGSPLLSAENEPFNYVVEGRVTFSPMGPVNGSEMPFAADGGPLPLRLSLTAQSYHGKLHTIVENFNPTNSILTPTPPVATQIMTMAGGDLWIQGGPVIVFGELYWRRLGPADGVARSSSLGAWGEVVVNAFRNILGVGVRVNWMNPILDLANDQLIELEAQVAWFIHPPNIVLKGRYAWLRQNSPGEASLGTFQLPFPPGTSNVATLQMTLAF